jgi:hypothetical protein
MKNRSFDDDPQGIKELIRYHGCIPMKNAEGELGIRIPMPCKHQYEEDGKVYCRIWENRPPVCKNYFCEPIIKTALEQSNGVCL